MRAWTLPVMIVIVAATLGGCGQKGPLYRENPEASPGSTGKAVSVESQSERPSDRDSSAE